MLFLRLRQYVWTTDEQVEKTMMTIKHLYIWIEKKARYIYIYYMLHSHRPTDCRLRRWPRWKWLTFIQIMSQCVRVHVCGMWWWWHAIVKQKKEIDHVHDNDNRKRKECIIKVSEGFLFQLLLSVLRRNQLLPSESFIDDKVHCSINPCKCKSYYTDIPSKERKKNAWFFLLFPLKT